MLTNQIQKTIHQIIIRQSGRVAMVKRPFESAIMTRQIQSVSLNNLYCMPNSKRSRIRAGRGNSSNKGNSAGKGLKGQLKRGQGKPHIWLEGGGSPLHRRIPKTGINKDRVMRYEPELIPLEKILYKINKGILDPSHISLKDLQDAKIFKKITENGVMLVCTGQERVDFPINIEVTDADLESVQSIKNSGGSVKAIWTNRKYLHYLVKPQRYELNLKQPPTPPRMAIKMEQKRSKGMDVVQNQPEFIPHLENEFNKTQKSLGRELTFPLVNKRKWINSKASWNVRRVNFRRHIKLTDSKNK